MTTRERLARTLAAGRGYEWDKLDPEYDSSFGPSHDSHFADVDAILAELREPDDKMIKAACKSMSPGRRPTQKWVTVKDKHRIRWKAMLDAITNETKEAAE